MVFMNRGDSWYPQHGFQHFARGPGLEERPDKACGASLRMLARGDDLKMGNKPECGGREFETVLSRRRSGEYR